ncbi:PrsW family intramembrane metalloprotease [Candidatus Peregrinibacteria bacterium]|nr:PrsW family intramembrane metalloprotease [Candidatus Peregrinibacteria bacterium]
MVALRYILVFLLAIVPAIVWMIVLLRRERTNKWLIALTFIGGMAAAKLILIYQGYWDQTANFIFFRIQLVDFRSNLQAMIANGLFAAFVVFLGVGVMEEYLKLWVMRLIDSHFFRSINDVIGLALVSALGFAFFENIVYFINNWNKLSIGGFFVFVLFRITVVTMVHLLCSGVFGYYYGMSYFASPMLQIHAMKNRTHPVLNFIKKVLRIRRARLYHDSMAVKGLLLAMFLHAIYDFVMSQQFTALTRGFPVYLIVMILYFFGGFWFLRNLMKKKEFQLRLGLVGTQVMPREDFKKLLAEVQEIKERMRARGETVHQKTNEVN